MLAKDLNDNHLNGVYREADYGTVFALLGYVHHDSSTQLRIRTAAGGVTLARVRPDTELDTVA